jgi:FtsZ-interacting cell division protein YlmF
MSALKNVAQGFRNLWGAADEEYDDAPDTIDAIDERESNTTPEPESSYRDRDSSRGESSRGESSRGESSRSEHSDRHSERYEKFTAPAGSNYGSEPIYGGGSGSGAGPRRSRPAAIPLRASREKNIYTLKPKSLDESSVAADYLKTGCAVVVNLEEVEGATAIRIIDFMSGVCYGLDHQGHAMKLGDKIFLFTPGDFEISSDETDYAENPDLIFKDLVAPTSAPSKPALKASVSAPASESASSGPERRSWER